MGKGRIRSRAEKAGTTQPTNTTTTTKGSPSPLIAKSTRPVIGGLTKKRKRLKLHKNRQNLLQKLAQQSEDINDQKKSQLERLSAISLVLDDIRAQASEDAEKGAQALGRARALSNKQRAHLGGKEMVQIGHVMENQVFKQSPFDAIKTHLRNTTAAVSRQGNGNGKGDGKGPGSGKRVPGSRRKREKKKAQAQAGNMDMEF
eukprot:TRINITY_DN2927_c0_g1_i4.p2 TRINITY_DN2927_c0_g1~~TRINITY_DN2927_c0_g1_i4.p2  ORF type:complete len:202 (+),score=32.20 TRINITY_DN2927_c0_g1_i4:83-688(+)